LVLNVNYSQSSGAQPRAQLIWARVDNTPSPEAITAAGNADVVIAVVGITSQLEGEEMPASEPGFLGGDRTQYRSARAGASAHQSRSCDGETSGRGADERERARRELGQ
jgi:hypothetical protein